MSHFSDKYVGKEYIIDVYDCVHLCVEVQQEEFGNKFEIDIDRERGLIKQTDQIDAHLNEYLIDDKDAKEGDLLLMRCKGRLTHSGIVCEINGTMYVLHNLRNIRSVAMHKISELSKWGCVPESFHRFK